MPEKIFSNISQNYSLTLADR